MGYESQRQAIESRMASNWTTTDLVFEEHKYAPTKGTAWVKLWVIPGHSEQRSVGLATNYYRSHDIIQVDINVPAETGTKTISTHADSIIAIFKGQKFSGITVRDVDVFRDRIDDWLRWSITFNCFRDEQ